MYTDTGVVKETVSSLPLKGKALAVNVLHHNLEHHLHLIDLPVGDMEVASRHTAAALTETLGCLAAEVHGIQTHGALGGSHVQAHIKPVRNVVVHTLFQTPAEL